VLLNNSKIKASHVFPFFF